MSKIRVLIRGGGDLASGVAARLFRAGFYILVTELPKPLVVRRSVSFAEAVFAREVTVENIAAERAENYEGVPQIQSVGKVAVLVDPALDCFSDYQPQVVVDARMRKKPPESSFPETVLHIGLGPGFTAGVDCQAVIETMRGHTLGRVIWQGQAIENTGIPESVLGKTNERVLRAPQDGILEGKAQIGDVVQAGDLLAVVGREAIRAPFDGVLRGLVYDGLEVFAGMKIGDLDPRSDPKYATLISDKALAIGGGVLEAVLAWGGYVVKVLDE